MAYGETATERNLRRQLEDSQAALAAVARDKAAMAAELVKIRATTNATNAATATASTSAANGRVEAKKAADKQVEILKQTGVAAAEVTAAQTEVIVRSAEQAAQDAKVARSQAEEFLTSNSSLIIIQVFIFLSVLASFIYKGFEHRWDTAARVAQDTITQDHRKEETKAFQLMLDRQMEMSRTSVSVAAEQSHKLDVQSAKIEQVHELVNSRMTEEMQENLDAQKTILILLQEAVDLAREHNIPVSKEATDRIILLRAKIVEKEAQLGDRKRQTESADKALAAKLKLKGTTYIIP